MTYNIIIGLALLLSAFYTSQKQGNVPNIAPKILIAIFGVSIVLLSDAPAIFPQILAGIAAFVLGFVCFAIWDDFGGGTAKILAVVALLTPVSLLPYTAVTLLAAYLVLIIASFVYYKVLKRYGEINIYYASLSLFIASIIIFLHVFGIELPKFT